MEKYKIDLPVLLIFFARPNTLKEVFKEVKKAKPSKLFLACDGPREGNPTDCENVNKCIEIVKDIDWECEVYRNYSNVNLGCGKGPSSAISWAFEYVDHLVILEDDCVPNQTLFPFMKEMLTLYKDDERVGLISGFNHFKDWDAGGNSYLFTKCGATLGWGTWKRVWDKYDYYVENINDKYYESLLKMEIINKKIGKKRCSDWKKASLETKQKKVNYWDIQFGFVKYSQSYLCIVPKSNLIYNIGVGAGSTHTEYDKYVKWKPGKILFMPTTDLEFPLVHPKYVICDRKYDETYFEKMGYPSLIKRAIKKIKRVLFKL